MGRSKHCLDLGYIPTENRFVCTKCIQEEDLQYVIRENSCKEICSYCDSIASMRVAVCNFDHLTIHICRSIQSEWSEPYNEGMSYDNEDEDWMGDTYSTLEVLQEVELNIENHAILEDISDAITTETWCKINPYSVPLEQEMFISWETFTKYVMTRSRYFFHSDKSQKVRNEYRENNCSEVLGYIGEIITQLDLIREISADQLLYRIRIVDPKEKLTTARELGSPPAEYATLPNRMSPAGISMFYGAFDKKTAIAETYIKTKAKKIAACGIFQPVRTLHLIDLSKKQIPSIFDEELRCQRTQLSFLFDFINDFTKPIDREARPHVDYVPTQIVTEYLRDRFIGYNRINIDGIIYPSSKNPDKNAVVIFANSDQCCDEPSDYTAGEQLLKLIKTSRTTIHPEF